MQHTRGTDRQRASLNLVAGTVPEFRAELDAEPALAPVIATSNSATAPAKVFPMMPWFPEWFYSFTRGWSVTERGIFQQLLDVQWIHLWLPSNPADLKKLLGATSAEWKSWPKVAPHFPICSSDGRRRNLKLEADRDFSIKKYEAHQRGAKKTNEKRWGTRVDRSRELEGGDGC
jgi:hypothetical protein